MKFQEFIANALNALKPDKEGFSVKKQIAAYGSAVFLVASIVYSFYHSEHFMDVLLYWLSYFGALLGIGAVEKRNDLKFKDAPKENAE